MQLGTTTDQGLYDKPSAAVHPGALAAGTLPEYKIPLDLRVYVSEIWLAQRVKRRVSGPMFSEKACSFAST